MNVISIQSDVKNGEIEPSILAHLLRCIKAFEGKRVSIVLKEYVKTRSGNQNRFLHGYLLPALRNMFRDAGSDLSAEQVKELFKQEFGVREVVTLPNGNLIEILKSTAKYTTVEFEHSMERARAWAAQYGVQLPFPSGDDL
jgi:hypothetical protein